MDPMLVDLLEVDLEMSMTSFDEGLGCYREGH